MGDIIVPVGGIAELPGVAGTPLETTGIVAAIAAGAVALGGAAWYAAALGAIDPGAK